MRPTIAVKISSEGPEAAATSSAGVEEKAGDEIGATGAEGIEATGDCDETEVETLGETL